jgi:hypothetical protein
MNLKDQILFRVLVEQDAIFTPNRLWKPRDIPVVLAERKQSYRLTGVRWRTEAESRPERREATQALRSLAVDRMVDVRVASRIAQLRLTAKGDAYVRALVGLPSLAESVDLVLLMAGDIADGQGWRQFKDGPDWIPETELIGVAYGNDAGNDKVFAGLEQLMMPAIAAGAVVAGSDIQGHVFYSLGDVPIPDADDLMVDLPAALPNLKRRYVDELEIMLRRLYGEVPEVENSCTLPLPVCGWMRR